MGDGDFGAGKVVDAHDHGCCPPENSSGGSGSDPHFGTLGNPVGHELALPVVHPIGSGGLPEIGLGLTVGPQLSAADIGLVFDAHLGDSTGTVPGGLSVETGLTVGLALPVEAAIAVEPALSARTAVSVDTALLEANIGLNIQRGLVPVSVGATVDAAPVLALLEPVHDLILANEGASLVQALGLENPFNLVDLLGAETAGALKTANCRVCVAGDWFAGGDFGHGVSISSRGGRNASYRSHERQSH